MNPNLSNLLHALLAAALSIGFAGLLELIRVPDLPWLFIIVVGSAFLAGVIQQRL